MCAAGLSEDLCTRRCRPLSSVLSLTALSALRCSPATQACPSRNRSFGAALFARDAGVLGVCRLALLFEPARGAALFVRLAGLVGERTCVPPPRRCGACRVRNECRRSTCICWTGRRVNNNPGLMRCSRTNNSGLLVEYEDPISDMRPPPRRCEACRVRNECRRSTCICWTGRLRAKPSSTSADSRLQ